MNIMKRWSFVLFSIICLCTLCAEWITNDKPIIAISHGHISFPAYFGRQNHPSDFAIWPPFKYGPHTLDYQLASPAAPSAEHLLGTDDHGRDVFARLLYGLRISLMFGFLLAILGSIIGLIIGGIQGYFGGRVDIVMGRMIEVWASIPSLFLILILATPNFFSLLMVMLFFNWLSLANTIRAEFFRARSLDYVMAAQVLGVPPFKMIVKHMLPNAFIGVRSHFSFMVSLGLVQLASLNFLGFGLPFGTPSLGDLLFQAKDNLEAPWIGISIFVTMSFVLGLLIFMSEEFKYADPR